ncbi:MAG: TlpA disulfide reductase family protein [Desulfomonilaceae bacterium]
MKSLYINLAYKFLALALLLFFFAGTAFAADLAADANIFMYPKPFKIADLRLQNTSGQMVSLADFKGKVVLLHFWSIRCPACRMEEPLLRAVKKSFGPAGLEILWVNLVDPPRAIAEHAASDKMPVPVLHGTSGGASLKVVNIGSKTTAFVVNPAMEAILEVPAFPTTYIIDCRGSAVGYSVGSARWNDKGAVGLIRTLLAQSKTCFSKSFMTEQKRYSMR